MLAACPAGSSVDVAFSKTVSVAVVCRSTSGREDQGASDRRRDRECSDLRVRRRARRDYRGPARHVHASLGSSRRAADFRLRAGWVQPRRPDSARCPAGPTPCCRRCGGPAARADPADPRSRVPSRPPTTPGPAPLHAPSAPGRAHRAPARRREAAAPRLTSADAAPRHRARSSARTGRWRRASRCARAWCARTAASPVPIPAAPRCRLPGIPCHPPFVVLTRQSRRAAETDMGTTPRRAPADEPRRPRCHRDTGHGATAQDPS